MGVLLSPPHKKDRKGEDNMEKARRRDAALLLGLFLAVILTGLFGFERDCETVRESVFRFHILANSDSEEDQARKLLVRDAVLRETAELFAGAESRGEALERARQNLPFIEETAEQALRKAGSADRVQASVTEMYFETRTYGDKTLPAGVYDALRLTIGKGEGHNWWCVMFPPLCVGAAADSESLRRIEALNETPEFTLSFAAVEWLEQLFEGLRHG